MLKLTWCAVARAPYLDFLHTEVNKHFDLEVYYKLKQRTHPWELDGVEYKNAYIDNNLSKVIKRVLSSDIVIVSGWGFWQHLIIMLIPMKSVKKVYWTDTPNLDKQKWSGLKGNIRRFIVKIVFKVFDEVWSTGKPGCEALEKMGCKKEKIRSFTFFYDLNRYYEVEKNNKALDFKAKYSNSDRDIIFVCMGKMITKKRFKDAIKAISLLNNRNAILWIVGTGQLETELQSLATELDVRNQVKFIGWLQQHDVELSFISADVFVHPSEFDPFPTVVLDAMTWGKPVIGTYNAGSIVDRVTHGKNGFIYNSGDINILASHMKFFIENKDEIKKYGAESRKVACTYPVDVAIAQIKSLVQTDAKA